MNKWLQRTLSEADLQIIDGDRGKNYPSKNDFSEDGFCLFLNTGNVTLRGFDFSNTMFIDEERDKLLRKGKLQRGDVILTTRGTVGNVAYYGNDVDFEHIRINSGMVIIRTVAKQLDPRFVYFFLRSRLFANQVKALTTGSAQPQLPIRDMVRISMPNPPICEQVKIASVLGALDDKIENNRRMNETLEEMARAIFKSWFVDFDPVHAKAAGNAPAHMDTETVALFPSSFGDDGLPVGWSLHSLRDVTEKITKGTTPSKKDLNEVSEEPCTINFLKVNNISDDGYFNQKSFEKIPESVHKNQLKRSILKKGDVLYSIAGTIGRVIIATDDILPSNTNQALAILRPKNELCPSGFLSLILKDENFQKELHSNIVQAVQANLSLLMISAQKFVFPPAEKIGQIFSPIENILKMQESNYTENQTLAELRDTLLPKLMSGEIRVKDAEREVERAI